MSDVDLTLPGLGNVPPAPKGSPAATNPAKRATKKAAGKRGTKKVTKKSKKAPAKKAAEKRPVEYGIEKSADLPWCEKKVAIFKALKSLRATSAADARSAKDVAAKAGNEVTTRDVRHYCYHAKVSGLTGIAELEDVRGYAFYLTAKGAKVDPTAELKAQSAK